MITIEIEIPEALYEAMQQHLELHSAWDNDRVGTAALALFLLQQGEGKAAATYLNSLFGRDER